MHEERLIRLTEFVIARIQKGWCQDACAIDKNDNPVAFNSKKAKKWSAYGAFHLGLDQLKMDQRHYNVLLDNFNSLLGGSIVRLNDEAPSVDSVVKSCRGLIARLEQ